MTGEESNQTLGHPAGILHLQQVGRGGKDEGLDAGQPREQQFLSLLPDAIQLLTLCPDDRKDRLFDQLSNVTRAIMFGTSVTALAQGFLVGVGFAIAGLPSPVVFGVLAALLSLLPIGGAAFVWVPAVIWLFVDRHWGYGIFMLVWGLILGGLDNVLRPMLISGRARISALAVFVGVLGGIPAFGAIGVIAGPVALSLALALVEFAEETRSRRA